MGRACVAAAVLVLLAGCAIQPDSAPRDVPVDERALLDPVDPEAGESAGSSRIFLVTTDDSGDRRLRSVLREVDQTPTAVLEELLLGPNQQELESGLRTDLPDGLVLLSARPVAGTLNVDVTPEILDLPGSVLVFAVAEIVFTASELDGVSAVRLRVDGEIRGWPDGEGQFQSTPLTVYDYPGLAESTQPPYPAIPSEPVA